MSRVSAVGPASNNTKNKTATTDPGKKAPASKATTEIKRSGATTNSTVEKAGSKSFVPSSSSSDKDKNDNTTKATVSKQSNSNSKTNSNKRRINVVLIGPPGCGKGTVAEKLIAEYGLRHLATGDMLREAVKSGSELGEQIKAIMDRGELVPDEFVISLIKVAIDDKDSQAGVILDGFPRNVTQAKLLDEMCEREGIKLDFIFEMNIEDELLITRITGRRVHPGSGRSYHILYHPPQVEGKDDVTGEDLIQRSDDNEETLSKRLNTYHSQTAPVLEYYNDRGMVTRLDASQKSDQVYTKVKETIHQSSKL